MAGTSELLGTVRNILPYASDKIHNDQPAETCKHLRLAIQYLPAYKNLYLRTC